MAKRGMPKIQICENWLIYWGICRKLRKQDIADMAYVSRPTIDSRFREMGISYRGRHAIKKRKEKEKKLPVHIRRYVEPTTAPPPWEKNSHISNFLVRLASTPRGQKVDVGQYLKQYREGVRNGRL